MALQAVYNIVDSAFVGKDVYKRQLVNNPTYYGICSDLRAIVRMAHEAGMLCLADEAHGLSLIHISCFLEL